ncbi:hypothetical protein HRbin19_01130 [bacterium HR19]|nr:hypothetical protein HRbin19_01130 [bacterium HR19]
MLRRRIYALFLRLFLNFLLLAFVKFVFAQSISCTSCKDEWCSSSTQVGVITQDSAITKNYSVQVSFSCSGCSQYKLRVAYDDSFGKKYLVEKNISDGDNTQEINFQNLDVSDGKILMSFEVSSTSASGYQTLSFFTCNIFYDDYPKRVSNVKAFGKDRSFLVQWDAVKDRDIQKYVVYAGYEGSCSAYTFETNTNSIEVNNLGGKEVENGVRYCGFVKAVDYGGKFSPDSDFFYVVPYKSLEFGKSSPPDENVGCVITYIFGRDSFFYSLGIALRNFLLRGIFGREIVKLYYEFSPNFVRFLRVLSGVFRNFFSVQESSADEPEEDWRWNGFFSFGLKFSSFGNAGKVGSSSLFSLAYGKRVFFADFTFSKNLFSPFGVLPVFISFDVAGSYLRGKRVAISDNNELLRLDENYSSMLISLFGVGIDLFADFVEEQIVVPFLSFRPSAISFFEYYDVGGRGVFGTVFGWQISGGFQILLDMFDRISESGLRTDYGIKDTYLFFGFSSANINLVRKKGAGFLSFKRSGYFDFSSFVFSAGVNLFY